MDWKITKDFSAKAAAAYYYFDDVQGKVSDPFVPQSSADAGDTDDSRPSFAQNGNTYIALRDITPDASNGFGTTNQYQYFGLATPFHDFAFTAQLDYGGFDPFHVWLVGEFVKNLAFDRNAILNNGPANARGPQNNIVGDDYQGGDTGWMVRLNAARPTSSRSGTGTSSSVTATWSPTPRWMPSPTRTSARRSPGPTSKASSSAATWRSRRASGWDCAT